MAKLTDNSTMPWGKYKGQKMQDISASYLIWCFDNNKCSPDVAKYISENRDVLDKEVEESKKY